MFGESIQVTGRSCEVSNEVETRVEPSGDFLSDILSFKFNGTITLTETCRTSNGVVTSDWVFKNEAYIELPISCSISSDEIKCGSLKLTSNKVTTVEVGPIRMKKITKQNVGERTVRITGKVFKGNFSIPTVFQSRQKTMWGLSLFYWILIGSVSGAVLVLVIIAGICGYKLSRTTSTMEHGQPTTGAAFVLNDINIHPGAKFRLGSMKRKRNNTRKLEEIEDQEDEPTRFEELEGVLTVGEQKALARKEAE